MQMPVDQLKRAVQKIEDQHELIRADVSDIDVNPKTKAVAIQVASHWFNLTDVSRGEMMSLMLPGFSNFEKRLHEKNEKMWHRVLQNVKTIADVKKPFIYVNNTTHQVLHVTAEEEVFSPTKVLDKALELLDKKFPLVHATFAATGLLVEFRTDSVFDLPGLNDTFRTSVYVENDFGEYPYIGLGLERMICTNMAYSLAKSQFSYLDMRIPTFAQYRRLENWDNTSLLKDLVTMRNTRCSYGEILNAHSSLSYINEMAMAKGHPKPLADLEANLPIHVIRAKYKITPKTKLTPIWKQTATTPIMAYDLFNYVTDCASNRGLTKDDAGALRVYAGELLMHKWDAKQFAPQVSWN